MVAFILYYFLSPSMYDAFNEAIGIDEFDASFQRIQWFTVFGMQYKIRDLPPGNENTVSALYTRSFLISFGYSALFGFLSCLVVAKKGTFKAKKTIKKVTSG